MRKTKIIALSVLCLAFICIFSLVSCSSKEITESNITSVKLKGKGENREIKIEAEFTDEFVSQHKGEKIYLIAKGSEASGSYSPLAEARVKSEIKFEIPFSEKGKDHLNTAFVCAIVEGEGDARKFTPVTDERYITNITDYGSAVSRPTVSSIKGLATDDIGHASYLGVQHVLLDVKIENILLEGYEDGAKNTVSQGRTYYFDGEQVEYFDTKIKEASDMGAQVYLRFTLSRPQSSSEEGTEQKKTIDCLYFPSSPSTATSYMPNLSNSECVGYMRALFDFFADRYSGGEHGTAIDYIIGQNVNNSSKWNNAGSIDSDELCMYYMSWVRMAYSSLGSVASNGRVYISLDEAWRASSGGALAFLNSFNANSRATGNFGWSIALSYGDMTSDTAWAGTSEYSDTLSADTLTELEGILKTDDLKYNGNQRSVIISSYAIKRNEDKDSADSRRSSSLAYIYYATQNSDCIDALIYSYYKDDTWGILTSNGEQTSLCDTLAICSSSRAGELSYLDTVIGSKWISLKDGDNFDKSCVYYASVSADKIKTSGAKRLFNFDEGKTYGFVPLGGAEYASLCTYTNSSGETSTCLTSDGSGNTWRVLLCSSLGKNEIKSSKYIGLTLSSGTSGDDFAVIISGTAKKTKDKVSFCARAQATSDPTEYYFDISDFADKLSGDDISMAICTPSAVGRNAGGLTVYSASLYGSSGSQVWKYILIAVAIVAVAGGLFALVRVLDKRSEKNKKKAHRATSTQKDSKKSNGSGRSEKKGNSRGSTAGRSGKNTKSKTDGEDIDDTNDIEDIDDSEDADGNGDSDDEIIIPDGFDED